jgi:uncharacterized protein involved in response to NO
MPADSAPIAAQRSRLFPHVLFYPAATLHAAVVLPLSVLSLTGVVAGPAALSTGHGHAHEMLLGYALAVVAGNQLPPMPTSRALALFAVWVLARASFVALPGPAASILDIAFIAALGMHVAPRLFLAAKKLRNQALPGVLTALCAGAIVYDVGAFVAGAATLRAILTAVVLLLAALMLFMGGRIIAPAAAGQLHRQGRSLAARVQPRIEGWLMVAMAVAVVAVAIPPLEILMRLACVGAGALALVRLLRWRLWACRGRADLMCLGAGYGWLALGLAAIAISSSATHRTAALHIVTVGALGTLTFNVMGATFLRKARRDPAVEPLLPWGTAAIGLATTLRVAAALAPGYGVELLVAAAACWAGAFLTLARLMAMPRSGRIDATAA